MIDSRCVRAAVVFLLVFSHATWAASEENESSTEDYGSLEYRLIGPAIGGRLTAAAGVPGDPLTAYFAAAQGGVWKTVNAGHSWEPIFDEELTQSIGALAIAPSDPNVLYIGSGEANIRGNVAIGEGIWVSKNAGKSFSHVLKLKGQVGRIAIHPRNAKIAYAAVLGSPFGPGTQRGLYRTRDAGKSWKLVLKKDADTGAVDVSIDQNNPRIVFASMWQARRSPWQLTSGGPGSGLHRSDDAGETWSELDYTLGLPAKPWGRVGVAVAPSNSARVYALIEAKDGGLFRSDDGGESFERVSAHRALQQRAWYYTTMTVDPRNADVVWFPQVPLLKTIDAGKTIVSVSGPSHGDHHDIWIDPSNTNRMLDAHDGGIDLSDDGGKTWRNPPLPLAQFYNLDVDSRTPYHIGGTIQDMGTASGPNQQPGGAASNLTDWQYVGGGEAGDFVYDLTEPGVIYAGEYLGYLSHFDEKTAQARNISAYPANPSGVPASEVRYRFQWTAPLLLSTHEKGALYHGANVVFKSTDRGETWRAVSPDLTRNDRSKQGWSGGPITGDITGVETFGTVFSLAESPVQAGVIWAGSDDGLLHVSQDGAKTWRNVTPKTLPDWATVESIFADPASAATAYVVAHRYRLDDHKPYLFKTTNFGQSWQQLGTDLPADLTLWAVRVDPEAANYIYLGTQRGLWFSRDAGKHFHQLALNLPNVTVTDIETKHGSLMLATRGRSLWALDALDQFRALDAARESDSLLLMSPKASVRAHRNARWGDGNADAMGSTETNAVITYRLPARKLDENLSDVERVKQAETRAASLRLEVRDANNTLLRTLTGVAQPASASKDDPDNPQETPEPELASSDGWNQATFDLRAQGVKRLDKAILDWGNPEIGPLLPPGTYQITLFDGAETKTTALTIQKDPRSTVSNADMEQNYRAGIDIRAQMDLARRLIVSIRALQDELAAQRGEILLHANPELTKQHESIRQSLQLLEESIHNPNAEVVYDVLAGRDGGAKVLSQLAPLALWLDQSDHAPTASWIQQFSDLNAELAKHQASFVQIDQVAIVGYRKALEAARAGKSGTELLQ